MSLEGSDQAGIIAVGAGLLLGLATGIFKAANLRGDSNSKWSSRVDLAVVALDEKTVVELRELRDEIDTVLPDDDAPFDPTRDISVNPAPLSERVERTGKYYTARVRMEKNLDVVCRLGRIFLFSLVMLVIAVVLLTIHFAELLDWDWTRWVGFGFGAVGAVVMIAAMIVYTVCLDRLAGGEILAETASQVGGSGDA